MKIVLVDASGSMSWEHHIKPKLDLHRNADLYMTFDTRIRDETTSPDEIFSLLKSPGGTAFDPAIVEALKRGATEIVVITDGLGIDWAPKQIRDSGLIKFEIVDHHLLYGAGIL